MGDGDVGDCFEGDGDEGLGGEGEGAITFFAVEADAKGPVGIAQGDRGVDAVVDAAKGAVFVVVAAAIPGLIGDEAAAVERVELGAEAREAFHHGVGGVIVGEVEEETPAFVGGEVADVDGFMECGLEGGADAADLGEDAHFDGEEVGEAFDEAGLPGVAPSCAIAGVSRKPDHGDSVARGNVF